MLRDLNTNEMQDVSGGAYVYNLAGINTPTGFNARMSNTTYDDEMDAWEAANEAAQDIQYTQGLNANTTDGMAYAYVYGMDIDFDYNNDGQTDHTAYDGDILSGVDADNNGQIDSLEQLGLLSQNSVLS